VPVAPTYPNAGPIRVTTGGQTAAGGSFTITAPPAPTGVQNVRSFGATGNGTTDDRAAIQRTFDAARPGEAVYFPAGTYLLRDTVALRTSNVRVYGDGDASTVRGDTTAYHLITVHNSGQTLTGVRFESLRFLGPRVFDKNVNSGNGVGMNNVTGTQFTRCTFEGCGTPIADGSNVSGTTVNNCRFIDWGNVGIFANGGASIRNSSFEQHDGSAQDGITSHGVYFHSNSNNCVVENCTFSGVRYYGIQMYGQDEGSTISNIRISGNRFYNNSQDIVVQTVGPAISQIYITNNSFTGTRGWPVQIKKGTDLHVDGNNFSGTQAGAVLVGDWSVYDGGSTLTNVSVDRNTYSGGGSPQYVFFISGARGQLSNVSVQGNSVDAFREPGTYQSAAIYLQEVRGATVANNTLTMASGAGSVNICAGVRVGG
jgi:parallel beta-helix repeat protein